MSAGSKHQGRLPGLNRSLVMELDRGRVRELLMAVALSALMLVPLLLYVWQSSEWIESGYRIDRLEQQRARLAETGHQLRLEKASLENLARIESLALTQLGLKEPPGGTVVLVDERRVPPPRRKPANRTASAKAGQPTGDPETHAAVRPIR